MTCHMSTHIYQPLTPGHRRKTNLGVCFLWEVKETTAGTELCICLWSLWTYLTTPPHTPHDSPNHRHDDLLHGKHRCLGDLLLSNCHRPQQQTGHVGGSHTNCSHTATPPSPPPPPPIVNRTPQLRGKNSKFKWGLNMTPRPSHAHLTVQMQSFPFRIICMIQLVTAVKMLSVYTLNSKVYTEKDWHGQFWVWATE